MSLPKNKIPFSLRQGIFVPEYKDREVDLNELLQQGINIERQKQAEQSVRNKVNVPFNNPIPVPLTEAEAEEADRLIALTQQRIVDTRNKLEATRKQIDTAINDITGGKDLSFSINIEKKPRIKRALRKLFGENLSEITYSMYIEMLKAKVQLEKDEVADYSAGRTKTS